MNVRFYLSYDIKITLKSHFLSKNVIILSLCTQRCNGRHNVSRKSVNISGLSILLHGVISLPDQTSYDYLVISDKISCTGLYILRSYRFKFPT